MKPVLVPLEEAEAHEQQRASAGANPPEPPRPLVREIPPADPFPTDALGPTLAPAARAIADKVQAPEAMCGQAVAACATFAVQGHADVELPTGQTRPISNFFFTVGMTGDRKSATDGYATAPIKDREKVLREGYDLDYPSYKNDVDAFEKARANILNNKKLDRGGIKAALDAMGDAPQAPLCPIMIMEDPTYEGAVKLFAIGQPSLGLFSAEGGQFIGGHGMSDEKKLLTATGLSGLWDGEPIRRIRAGDGAMVLPGRRLAMHLMAQPDVASVMLSDRVLLDQGLLSRLLVTAPQSLAGKRVWREPSPESEISLKKYNAHLRMILSAPLSLAEGKLNELTPRRLTLSSDARRLWIGFADDVERKIAGGGPMEPIRGLANKLPEHAARLAAVLTLIKDIRAPTIQATELTSGIDLAQHYAAEALRLFAMGQTASDLLLAQKVLAWLTTGWEGDIVSLPDIYRLGPNAVRDKATASKVVNLLEDHGWLTRLPNGAVINDTPRRDAWRIIGGAA